MKQYTITVSFGSDWQKDLRDWFWTAVVKWWFMYRASKHKGNNVDIQEQDIEKKVPKNLRKTEK